jgi:hypothetical protein
MAKKPANTNFRLGLNRQELIAAAQQFGKSEKTAKKDSTKRLESYLTNKWAGKGAKVPTLTDKQKRDVRDSINNYGIQEGIHLAGYQVRKQSGTENENNWLRTSVARSFASYYDKLVTSDIIDELISRMPMGQRQEVISGVTNHDTYYQNIFIDYAEELEKKEEEKQNTKE